MSPQQLTSIKKTPLVTAAFSYEQLPDEITIQIFSHLPGDDLLKVSLVSRTWNRISQDRRLRPKELRLVNKKITNRKAKKYVCRILRRFTKLEIVNFKNFKLKSIYNFFYALTFLDNRDRKLIVLKTVHSENLNSSKQWLTKILLPHIITPLEPSGNIALNIIYEFNDVKRKIDNVLSRFENADSLASDIFEPNIIDLAEYNLDKSQYTVLIF